MISQEGHLHLSSLAKLHGSLNLYLASVKPRSKSDQHIDVQEIKPFSLFAQFILSQLTVFSHKVWPHMSGVSDKMALRKITLTANLHVQLE